MDDIFKNYDFEYLMRSERAQKLQQAVETFSVIQERLHVISGKYSEKELSALKAATMLTIAVINKISGGKPINEFTEDDWKEAFEYAYKEGFEADPQSYTIKVFLTYANYLEVSATRFKEERGEQIKGLADTIREMTEQLEAGELKETEYIEECRWISLEGMVKCLAGTMSYVVPADYRILVDAVSSFAFEYGRYRLYSKEQELLAEYIEKQKVLDIKLQERYDAYIEELEQYSEQFNQLIEEAFSYDFSARLRGSIELARMAGVDETDILTDIGAIDDFFLS